MTSIPRTRLYLDAPLGPDKSLSLSREQSHYLMNVLRAEKGERVLVFNGRDGEFEAEIIPENRKQATAVIHDQTRPQPASPSLMLAFAPIKKARIDFIAEKATELGVGILQPVITAYTNVTRVNTGRLAANAIEAAEQTGRLTIPEIREPLSLTQFLDSLDADYQVVFCDEGLASGDGKSMIKVLSNTSGPAAVLIGPEGGFSDAERDRINADKRSLLFRLAPISCVPIPQWWPL